MSSQKNDHEKNLDLPERYLTPAEVAEILGIPVETIYQWRYKRTGTARLTSRPSPAIRPAETSALDRRPVRERGLMPSVHKWKDGYRARWRSPDGKSRSKVFARKVDAKAFLATVEHTKQTGNYVDPAAGRLPFRKYAEDWRLAQPHRHGTSVAVEQHLRLHVYPVIGSRPIAAIRPSEIQALVSKLASTLSPSTIAVVYGRIVAVFRSAVRDRAIGWSPCVDIRLPSANAASAVSDVLTTSQVLALADAVPKRYRAVVLAGAGLGLRPGELFGLTLDRVEFLKWRVRVEQQLVRIRGTGVVVGPLKTPSSYRTVPLPEHVARAIATYIETFGPHPELGLVFTNERRAPIQQFPFSTMFTTARSKAGLPEWATPHDLRHFLSPYLSCSDWPSDSPSVRVFLLAESRVVFLWSAAHDLELLLVGRLAGVGCRASAVDPRGDAGADRRRPALRGRPGGSACHDGCEPMAAGAA